MSQIKNSFTDAMHRFSRPSGNQSHQKKEKLVANVQKFKWPSMKASRPQQQQKKDAKAKFSIKRSSLHQRNAPHQKDTGKNWGLLRGGRSGAHHPSPSFDLRKAVKWANLSKKNNRATGKAPAASKPSLLRFRQR